MFDQMKSKEIQVFTSQTFGSVRAVSQDGKVLFCGKDVAKSLGYADTAQAIRSHCKGVVILTTPSPGGNQQTKFITQTDVLRLIMSSTLPDAERFQDWVFEEVLPSVIATGSYSMPKSEPKPKSLPSVSATRIRAEYENVRQLKDLLNLSSSSVAALANKVADKYELATKVDYVPDESNGRGVLKSATELLKSRRPGMKTNEFNNLMAKHGYLTKNTRMRKNGSHHFWTLTKDGLAYGQNSVNPQNPKETQPQYYEDMFDGLLDTVTATPFLPEPTLNLD